MLVSESPVKVVPVGAGFYLGLGSEEGPRYPLEAQELWSGNGPDRQQGAGGGVGRGVGFISLLLLI